MPESPKAFLDTSALFAGLWSAEGGGRLLLKLGEAGAVRLFISPQVLEELDRTLRRKAPNQLGNLTVVLDRCRIEVAPAASAAEVERCAVLTRHAGDAAVLAAAWQSEVQYLVTLDRTHLLGNEAVANAVPFPLGTPGDFLAWFRAQFA